MASRSGGSGVLYALILFVFLFIFSLALAILFYTQKLKVEEQVATFEQVDRDFVSPTERRSDEYQQVMDARGSKSVYGQLSTEIDALKRKLTGNGGASMEQVDAQVNAAGIETGENALAQIAELRSEIAGLNEQVASKQQAVAEADKTVKQLEAKLNTLTQSSNNKIKELSDTLDQRQTEWKQFEQSSNAEREEVVKRLEQARADAKASISAKNAEISALKSQINTLNGRINELSLILKQTRLTAPDLTLEADGRIVDVDLRDNVVYVNLGRDDRLILGMTFEVFDQTTGVQTEISRNGALVHKGGKATIEVVRFSESGATAICRIVRQAYGRPIVTGDLISNIVYDKNRTFRFFVYGDFDLNGDNLATPSERQRIINLIERWGGEVIDSQDMPVDTDFLVLGQNIEYPTAPPDEPPPPPEVIEQYLRDKERFLKYQELAGLARELSIPVLNQNRFLTLIGYYGN